MATKKKDGKAETKKAPEKKAPKPEFQEREEGEAFEQRLHGVAVGATFESLDPADDERRRRVKVLQVGGAKVLVEDAGSYETSTMAADELTGPGWRFVA